MLARGITRMEFVVCQRLESLGHVAKASLRKHEVYPGLQRQRRAYVFSVIGEENDLRFWEHPLDDCRRFDAVHYGHPEVDQDEVWFQYLRLLDGL